MANWSKNKTLPANINSGNEYAVDDNVSLENLNAITNNSFYAMDKAEEAYTEAHSAFMNNGTVVSVNNTPQTSMSFDSDPQTQITQLGNKTNQISNPNLLINGDFNINQRGNASYTSGYCVDRWFLYGASSGTGSFTIATKTLERTSVSGNIQLNQWIENSNELLGQTVTLSAKINGVVYSKTQTLPSSITSDENYTLDITDGQIRILQSNGRKLFRADIITTGTFIIDYVKLEIGSLATPFNPRPYAEELSICQRYYLKAKLHGMCASAYSATVFYPFLNTPTSLRTSPTITITTNPKVRGQGSNNLGTTSDIIIQNKNDNGCSLKVTFSGLSTGYFYEIADGECTLDAEI